MAQWTYVAIFMLLMACNEQSPDPPPVAEVPAALHYPAVLPKQIANYLHETFPQWRVVEKSDYSNTWWSFYDSSYNPCWVRTDINDDQLADYAVLLKKEAALRLVICTGKANLL